jgi:hypothetical protein
MVMKKAIMAGLAVVGIFLAAGCDSASILRLVTPLLL